MSGATTECRRCGVPCRPGDPDENAIVMRAGRTGYCPTCALTYLIRATPSWMMGIERNGIEMLLDPGIQAGYARLFASGHAQVDIGEINWPKLVRLWAVPFPGRRQPDGTPTSAAVAKATAEATS